LADVRRNSGAPNVLTNSRWLLIPYILPALDFNVPGAIVLLIILFSALANNTKGIVPTAVGRYALSSITDILRPGETKATMVFFL
jgi:putative effector of murein hydrolase LrgA (UPF0299 family)